MLKIRSLKKLSKSFLATLLFLCVFCNLIFTSIVGIVSLTQQNQSLKDISLYYTRKILSQAVSTLEQSIEPYRDYITQLSLNSYLIGCVDKYKQMELEQRLIFEKRYKQLLDDIIKLNPEIRDIIIIGNNGYLYNKDAASGLDKNYDFLNSSWYQEAYHYDSDSSAHIAPVTSDFYIRQSPLLNLNLITISQPVFNYQREKIGVIFCYIDASVLSNQLLSDFDEYGGIFLCDQNDRIILHPDPNLNGTKMAYTGDILNLNNPENVANYQLHGDELISFLPSKTYDAKVVCKISLSYIDKSKNLFKENLLLFFSIGLLFSFGLSLLLFLKIQKRFKLLIHDIDQADCSNTSLAANQYYYQEFDDIARHFQNRLTQVVALNNENQQIQLEVQKAKLNALIAQINPHFLFNTLQLLQTELLFGSKETANNLILSLSTIFRYSISREQSNAVARLSDELTFIENYLKICCNLHHNPVSYSISCPKELSNCVIPKFILQPIVENCFMHGFKEPSEHNCIQIEIYEKNRLLSISIEDNGTGIPQETIENIYASFSVSTTEENKAETRPYHIGLKNIYKRLILLFGESGRMIITSDPAASTKIEIRLPLTENGA